MSNEDFRIPLAVDDLPTDTEPLDPSLVYTGTIKTLIKTDKVDKQGGQFLKGSVTITEPEEWSGKVAFDNYIPLPMEITSDMNDKERRLAKERGVKLGRLSASAKMKGQPHLSEYLDREVQFTIRNQEYPEGSGRMTSSIQDYLV